MSGLASTPPVGSQLRTWRTRRRLSQLALALQADISTRHLSFLETGRSQPSREMVLRLAHRLDVPLRERNHLLTAAGFAPMYRAQPLADAALAPARRVVERVLQAHEPFPALAVDRHWNVVAQNRAIRLLLEDVSPALLEAPVNALRLSLHPDGMAPRIVNFRRWRQHVLARLQDQSAASGDDTLRALEAELAAYPSPPGRCDAPADDPLAAVALPLVLDTRAGRLTFLATTTVFGTPVDITLSELALETFFPADEPTAAALRRAFEGPAGVTPD